jgi:4-hydroxybutyryl-CoA dehydratase/vinylacetyl-CoA-Delta-isomerase
VDAATGSEYNARFDAWLHAVQDADLSIGIAMTDAKGDRSLPHQQANPDSYLHIVARDAKGITLSGTKAIVTGAPYMHEFLVMPGRQMGRRMPTLPCAAPCPAMPRADHRGAPRRAAGREGGPVQQQVWPVHRRADLRPGLRALGAGLPGREWQHSGQLTWDYATHHRHSCIAARAGFGDLLIGAGR